MEDLTRGSIQEIIEEEEDTFSSLDDTSTGAQLFGGTGQLLESSGGGMEFGRSVYSSERESMGVGPRRVSEVEMKTERDDASDLGKRGSMDLGRVVDPESARGKVTRSMSDGRKGSLKDANRADLSHQKTRAEPFAKLKDPNFNFGKNNEIIGKAEETRSKQTANLKLPHMNIQEIKAMDSPNTVSQKLLHESIKFLNQDSVPNDVELDQNDSDLIYEEPKKERPTKPNQTSLWQNEEEMKVISLTDLMKNGKMTLNSPGSSQMHTFVSMNSIGGTSDNSYLKREESDKNLETLSRRDSEKMSSTHFHKHNNSKLLESQNQPDSAIQTFNEKISEDFEKNDIEKMGPSGKRKLLDILTQNLKILTEKNDESKNLNPSKSQEQIIESLNEIEKQSQDLLSEHQETPIILQKSNSGQRIAFPRDKSTGTEEQARLLGIEREPSTHKNDQGEFLRQIHAMCGQTDLKAARTINNINVFNNVGNSIINVGKKNGWRLEATEDDKEDSSQVVIFESEVEGNLSQSQDICLVESNIGDNSKSRKEQEEENDHFQERPDSNGKDPFKIFDSKEQNNEQKDSEEEIEKEAFGLSKKMENESSRASLPSYDKESKSDSENNGLKKSQLFKSNLPHKSRVKPLATSFFKSKKFRWKGETIGKWHAVSSQRIHTKKTIQQSDPRFYEKQKGNKQNLTQGYLHDHIKSNKQSNRQFKPSQKPPVVRKFKTESNEISTQKETRPASKLYKSTFVEHPQKMGKSFGSERITRLSLRKRIGLVDHLPQTKSHVQKFRPHVNFSLINKQTSYSSSVDRHKNFVSIIRKKPLHTSNTKTSTSQQWASGQISKTVFQKPTFKKSRPHFLSKKPFKSTHNLTSKIRSFSKGYQSRVKIAKHVSGSPEKFDSRRLSQKRFMSSPKIPKPKKFERYRAFPFPRSSKGLVMNRTLGTMDFKSPGVKHSQIVNRKISSEKVLVKAFGSPDGISEHIQIRNSNSMMDATCHDSNTDKSAKISRRFCDYGIDHKTSKKSTKIRAIQKFYLDSHPISNIKTTNFGMKVMSY